MMVIFVSDLSQLMCHRTQNKGYEAKRASLLVQTMQSTGLAKQGQVFNSRSGCKQSTHLLCYEAKLSDLKLNTRPMQLL
jgi:hypothetical protein